MYHIVHERESALWMRLNEEDTTIAAKQEEAMHSTHYAYTSSDYSCIRCRERMNLLAIKSHIRFQCVQLYLIIGE